jgi:hypothetical protein
MYPFMDRIAAGAIFSLSGLGRVAILRQVVRQATLIHGCGYTGAEFLG